ncbi:MAG: deoxynucleoside kinase [Candidatus Blackburnbacteria bacterium]|nr:deoxynucleoside kinase [Candidatus Blackburnbacteria bacterium]
MIISFSGVHGCGKTTVVDTSHKLLEYSIVIPEVVLPVRLGEIFHVSKPAIQWVFLHNEMKKKLKLNSYSAFADRLYLVDRWYQDSLFYTSIYRKMGFISSKEAALIRRMYSFNEEANFIQPDIKVLLTCSLNALKERIVARGQLRDYEQDWKFTKSVHDTFKRHSNLFDYVCDTTKKSPEDIVKEVQRLIVQSSEQT